MKEKLKNKRVVYTIIGIISLLLLVIAVTYAYWLVTKTQTNSNIISTGCLDITLSDEANDISLTNQFPISDEDGMALTPYTFTVTNNCNTSVDYHINLESIGSEDTAIDGAALKAVIDDNTPRVISSYVGADVTISGAYASNTLVYGTLAASSDENTDDTVTHKLRIWIDENAPISEMNKTYSGKISVMVGQGVSSDGSTLASLILADAQTNNYLYTTTPTFKNVNADGEYGIYKAQDDLGDSYYFRGDVENNYVKFGKMSSTFTAPDIYKSVDNDFYFESEEACTEPIAQGAPWTACEKIEYFKPNADMYWRIVRINGDETVRLIYDGIALLENNVTREVSIAKPDYGLISSSPSYNTSPSKEILDSWYETNLKDKYGKYIADSIFCNDISGYGTNRFEYAGGGNIDLTGFASMKRLHSLATESNPILTCPEAKDRYTVSAGIGNGLLTNPIALITADEIVMAGHNHGSSNPNTYLGITKRRSWTMTPVDESSLWFHENQSFIYTEIAYSAYGDVRPVINIKANVLFEGRGTIDSPYEIVSE